LCRLARKEGSRLAAAADDKVRINDAGDDDVIFSELHAKAHQSHPQDWIGFFCAEAYSEPGPSEDKLDVSGIGVVADRSQGGRARFNAIFAKTPVHRRRLRRVFFIDAVSTFGQLRR
jgi:hypothetical protein